jgi:pyruvate,water dikinase
MTTTHPATNVDPLHVPGRPDQHWTTVNVGEALPGVATPLGWSIWADIGDQMCRDLSYAIGAYSAAERRQPPPGPDRIISPFFGRIAMRIEWMAEIGDRMPGITGQDAIAALLGEAPPTMSFAPTKSRYPAIAARLPRAGLGAPRAARRLAPEIDAWWRTTTPALADADLAQSVGVFNDARRRFSQAMTTHGIVLFAAIQPLLDAVTKLVARTGVGEVGVLSGSGGAEMLMVDDIWRASRGDLTLDEVVRRHGYHGPLEGEISSRVWREDNAPLATLVARYAAQDEASSPLDREHRAAEARAAMQADLLAALPASRRAPAKLILRQAARTVPLRGLGKASFLQALDVARTSARRVGHHLSESGRLNDPEDVFYLTVAEITEDLPTDAKELVARRRQQRAEYQTLELPSYWQGTPTPRARSAAPAEQTDEVLTGIGASAGVVEGPVRVVTDPSFADVEPGEVLVAPTSDPSWASIMFVSAALVVDIGSALSHAAVVARELGLPCVVNTRTGTRALRDGDIVRVDGSAGTVEIVKRAGSAPEGGDI